MKQYHNLLRTILEKGEKKSDRTGTGTISIFGHQMRFNLNDGFPWKKKKKLHLRSIIHELLWFLNGDNNIKYLNDNGVRIWEWMIYDIIKTRKPTKVDLYEEKRVAVLTLFQEMFILKKMLIHTMQIL